MVAGTFDGVEWDAGNVQLVDVCKDDLLDFFAAECDFHGLLSVFVK